MPIHARKSSVAAEDQDDTLRKLFFAGLSRTNLSSSPHIRSASWLRTMLRSIACRRGLCSNRSSYQIVLLLAIFLTLGSLSITNITERIHSSRAHPNIDQRARLMQRSAKSKIDRLYSQQSQSLAQATARYTLKNNRAPPLHFNGFYTRAKENGCLIDDYEQVHSDFEPFYQMAQRNRSYFSRAIEDMSENHDPPNVEGFRVVGDGGRSRWMEQYTEKWLTKHTLAVLDRLQPHLQSFSFFNSWQDEPRVPFDVRLPSSHLLALVPDPFPLQHVPNSSLAYYGIPTIDNDYRPRCILPNAKKGFADAVNNYTALLTFSPAMNLAEDLRPLMSFNKIEGCFADILIPSHSYYPSWKGFGAQLPYDDDIRWEDKQELMYWRGVTSGGPVRPTNEFQRYPRFRLLDLSSSHPLMDMKFTSIVGCEECDEAAIKSKYDFEPNGAKKPEVYANGFKYLLVIDGNGYSGRMLSLMRSNSLVFKSTIFTEFFTNWMIPFEHFIPILPDLSDLEDRLQWAIDNDEEAQQIALNGREFASRVMTVEQNDCYYHAVMLEWGRLYNGE